MRKIVIFGMIMLFLLAVFAMADLAHIIYIDAETGTPADYFNGTNDAISGDVTFNNTKVISGSKSLKISDGGYAFKDNIFVWYQPFVVEYDFVDDGSSYTGIGNCQILTDVGTGHYWVPEGVPE